MFSRHDLHTHTNYSDGTSSPAEMVEAASGGRLEVLAITDHGPDLSVGIRPGEIDQMIKDVEFAKSDANFPVLTGMEANIVDMEGNIDIGEGVLERLDLVLAGIHYLSSSETSGELIARDYLKTVLKAMENCSIDILAHPFWYHEDLSSYISREDLELFAEVAVDRGVAIELNGKYRVPSGRLLSICDEAGTRFSFGTDAHKPEEIGRIGWMEDVLGELEVDKERLIVEELV